VRVLLRRAALRREKPAAEEVVGCGPLSLDLPRHTALWKDRPLALTVTEFRILLALARRPGHVRTREQLLQEGFPHDQYMSDRTIDSHIKRIRRKLDAVEPGFAGIESIYGLGYRYRPDGQK
jgi:two-component system, OmpR family, response regulator ChvI